LCFTTFRSLIMDAFRQDVRFALRAFARRPAFALSAILSLGLGIAASSAVFSLINAALFKPIPGVTRPERLVEISRSVNGETSDVTWEVFSRFREERAILEDVSALALVSASIAGTNEPVARGGLAVTGNYGLRGEPEEQGSSHPDGVRRHRS
jgi:hypothetical protein